MTEPRPSGLETDPQATPSATTHAADAEEVRRSDEDVHAADAHHVAGGHDHAHATGHGNNDEHEADHGEPPAGPIDWGAWMVSIVGLAAGGVVAVVIAQVLAHG